MSRSSGSGRKGQWFIISAVVASGIFLGIAAIFDDFSALDSSKYAESSAGFYFNEISNALNGLNDQRCAEAVHFFNKEMTKKGMAFFNGTRSGACSFSFLMVSSEKAEYWKGERPVVKEMRKTPGPPPAQGTETHRITFGSVTFDFTPKIIFLDSQLRDTGQEVAYIDGKSTVTQNNKELKIRYEGTEPAYILVSHPILLGNALFDIEGNPVLTGGSLPPPAFTPADLISDEDVVQCTTDSQCTSGTARICSSGSCVECTDNNKCTQLYGSSKPYCSSGFCVECTSDSQCTGGKTCSGGTCISGTQPPPPSTATITNGLIAWWKLDETIGTTAIDTQGSYNGNIVGGATVNQPGKIGKAYYFSGSGSVRVSGTAVDFGTGDFTITFWGKLEANKWQGWMFRPTSTDRWQLMANTANGYADFELSDHTVDLDATGVPFTSGTWYHVALQRSGTNWNLFINGNVQATDTSPATTSFNKNGDFHFGAGYESNEYRYLKGWMDDVRIYNRALSSSEIMQIYNLNG